jgi:hypothetical protein
VADLPTGNSRISPLSGVVAVAPDDADEQEKIMCAGVANHPIPVLLACRSAASAKRPFPPPISPSSTRKGLSRLRNSRTSSTSYCW